MRIVHEIAPPPPTDPMWTHEKPGLLWWVEELGARAYPYVLPSVMAAALLILAMALVCGQKDCAKACEPAPGELFRGKCMCETDNGYQWAR